MMQSLVAVGLLAVVAIAARSCGRRGWINGCMEACLRKKRGGLAKKKQSPPV
jgi:hypothetical protein